MLLGDHQGHPQKNWMPYLSGDFLWLVTGIAPQSSSRVRKDDLLAASGVTTLSLLDTGQIQDERALRFSPGQLARTYPWRGSSQLVPNAGFLRSDAPCLLSLVHRRMGDRKPMVYETAFAKFDTIAPHRLLAISRAFRFDVTPEAYGYPMHPQGYRSFAYASGLYLTHLTCSSHSVGRQRDAGEPFATLTFGLDDCAAFSVDLAKGAVEALFASEQGVDSPALVLPWAAYIDSINVSATA